MNQFIKLISRIQSDVTPSHARKSILIVRSQHKSATTFQSDEEEEFRVLEILPKKKQAEVTKRQTKLRSAPIRANQMPIDQDWTNVWPGPRSFHPATVPLPVRQGYPKKGCPPPSKFANAELMKIPNFLHLTPPAIKKHCEAIKKFCTKWPEELTNAEEMEKYFPIEIISSDYCHSSPIIRDPLSRIISLKIKLRSLELDEHARDKLLRLVGKRYNSETDTLTITTDTCPIRKQNYDHAQYLLTALYYESWNVEDWEKEKCDADMEKYIWSERQCKRNVMSYLEYTKKEAPDLTKLGEAVENLFNDGENEYNLNKYKEQVVALLSLPTSLS